ncbi:MAG: TlyA family RNA methyltransferase [Spirochaetes bacterium]|nr:TlyA family RNA methyltransferase [Spirochaetota bacterium]
MKKESLLNIILRKFNLAEKEALGLILAGRILVDEKVYTKAGLKFDENRNFRIKDKNKYVSRGAYKLINAINRFNLNVYNKVCMDIGSSTGGFTQVLLERGAKKVFAVDCGKNQLHYDLRKNAKIISVENKKITELKAEDIGEIIDFAVMDVSFTSSLHIIHYIFNEFLINELVALIKPQFEYEKLKDKLKFTEDFKGIVKTEEERIKIINYLKSEIITSGFKINDIIESGIKGTKGNIEYFFYIKRL